MPGTAARRRFFACRARPPIRLPQPMCAGARETRPRALTSLVGLRARAERDKERDMVKALAHARRSSAHLAALSLALILALGAASDASARPRRAPRVRPAPPPVVQTFSEPQGGPVPSQYNRCGACGSGGGG